MSDHDDLRAEWEALAEAGSERVLDQEAIDSLLGFDKDAASAPPTPTRDDIWHALVARLTGWSREDIEVALIEERERVSRTAPPHSHGERDQ